MPHTPSTPTALAPAEAPALLNAPVPARLKKFLSLRDFEVAARKHLPRPLFGYVAGASEDNASLTHNRSAFSEYALVPRVLRNVSRREQHVTLFGQHYAAPFGIAPMGISALTAYRGDLVLARAAAAAHVPMIVSGSSLIRMEDVIAHYPQAWFQAYVPGEVSRIGALLDRVEAAGYGTLVITVDVAVTGNRENNVRCGFSSPLRPSLGLLWQGITHPAWLIHTGLKTLLRHGMPHFENSSAKRGAPILSRNVLRDFGAKDHLDWSHLDLIRRRWKGTLIVKGILHPGDAWAARERGADGIIVSNHGGRQLDGAISPLRALEAVVSAVGDYPVMVDSGFRRGTDILKALALGARFVFVGRPFNYAASVAGEAGVAHLIRLLQEEIHRDMALLGVSHLSELDRDYLCRIVSAHA